MLPDSEPPAAPGLIARVLLDSPLPQLDHPFDYAVPADVVDAIRVGSRVKVPLRTAGRTASAYVLELVGAAEADFDGRLSEVAAVVSSAPVLAPEVYTLARSVADRAAGTASDVIRLAVPSRAARVEKAWLARRSEPGESRPRQDAPEHVGVTGYPANLAAAASVGERLAVAAIPSLAELPSGEWVGRWAITLAELAVNSLADGRSAIIAVPDYRDQAQLDAALSAMLPADAIARLDARQADAERYRAFLSCLEDRPMVVIGNRSALYAPVSALGLIALWDDGDPLFAEPLAPGVHARDVALIRQRSCGASLVFIGNTRSVDVARLVEIGWVREIAPERATRPRVIPTARQAGDDPIAQAARIPSAAWTAARAALADRPVLVQVASPGFTPWLACADCGETARCARCGGPLGERTSTSAPTCRLCGTVATGWRCPVCSGARLRSIGAGSARTAEELGRAFPGTQVIVADGDHPVLTVPARSALVIATRGAEPVAAGGYGAVLLLDGERMLARESLRVGEDCLRWWSDAAVLAAPGAPVFLAGASGPVADALLNWDHAGYAARELADRRALRFPPAVRVASLTGEPAAVAEGVTAAKAVDGLDVLGPVPTEEGQVRAVLRFDYAAGPEVAAEVRAGLVRASTRRRKTASGRWRATPTLRVRFDDHEIL